MKICTNELYHVYNQGNNHEQLFYTDTNYIRFLFLYRKLVLPYCETLAYCLMPNHFHFLIYANTLSVTEKKVGHVVSCNLTNGFRLLQGSYTQYLNAQQGRSGSLFRQRVKIKNLSEGNRNYGMTAFNYIHQNPFEAGFVSTMENWTFSSYQDYIGFRKGTLCNRALAAQLLDFDERAFTCLPFAEQDKAVIKHIFEV